MNTYRLRLRTLALPLLLAAACKSAPPGPPNPVRACPFPDALRAGATDPVVLEVTPGGAMLGRHLQVWLQLPAQRPNLDSLQLFVDGHPIPGVRPRQVGPRCAVGSGSTATFQEMYEFVPVRTDASREMWAHLLGSPTSPSKTVLVGAGLANGPEFKRAPAGRANVVFTVFDQTVLWIASALFLALLVLLVWAGATTWILRDPTSLEQTRPDPPQKPPFSLAKVVMAMWTFLVLAGFFGIWMITGDHHGILTPQSLLLLGIVGATAAASNAMTRNKDQRLTDEIRDLRLMARALRSEEKELNEAAKAHAGQIQHAGIVGQAKERAERAAAVEIVLRAAEAQAPTSKGFFLDLISDGNGPALYRFQNLLWNVVFGFVFILGTYRALALPEFDANLMILMGISEGMYLGLKLPSPAKQGLTESGRPAAISWWQKVLGLG